MKIYSYFKTVFVTLVTILGASIVKAQPVLTATANGASAAVGIEQYKTTAGQNLSEGPAGAAQTWNFDTINYSANVLTLNYTSCPIPGGACDSFPSATFAIVEAGGYNPYMNTSASATTIYGYASPGVFINFTDPEEIAHFPFTYNDSYTDSFSSYTITSTFSAYEWGRDSVVADGWGTITTAAGTYSHVLRIKKIHSFTDSNSSGYATSEVDTVYSWYSDSLRDLVFEMSQRVGGTNIESSVSWLINPTSTSVMKNTSTTMGLQILQNPVTDVLIIDVQTTSEEQAMVLITDVAGRTYYSAKQQLAAGETKLTVDMQRAATGLYFITVSTPDGKVVKKVEKL